MTTHHHPPADPIVFSFPHADALTDALATFVIRAQRDAIDRKGRFTLALSGGSLPKQLAPLVGRDGLRWDLWHIYYADERAVPLTDEHSNHALCQTHLYSKVPIPSENIHALNPALLDDLDELADDYEKALVREFARGDAARFPVFDLVLLGVGPDGHTASLFPGHALLSEEDRWVAPIDDSPKPPPKRITLTYLVLNHALRVAFVAAGENKADTLHTVIDKPEEGLPASRVRPVNPGQLYWFVDDAASAKVQYPRTPFDAKL